MKGFLAAVRGSACGIMDEEKHRFACERVNTVGIISHQPRRNTGLIGCLPVKGLENISARFIHRRTDIKNGFANYPAACSPITQRLIFIFFGCGNF